MLSSPNNLPLRWIGMILCLMLVGYGCQQAQNEDAGGLLDKGNPEADEDAECTQAEDCSLAASTCCECPTFGAPAQSGYTQGCEDVHCEAQTECSAVEAACDVGRCVMVCSPVIADRSCAGGFARDAAGCVLNECLVDDDNLNGDDECQVNSDCVQVAADCCGCGRGGLETAVPVVEAAGFTASLACTDAAVCPEVDICIEVEPRCEAGLCKLSGPAPAPDPNENPDRQCGSPDLAPCESGEVCVLNDPQSNNAGSLDLGVCRPE